MRTIVDFVPGSEPIRGQIILGAGSSEPFVGWLALLGLLERALSNATDDQRRRKHEANT